MDKLIADNYTIELKKLKLIDEHFGTEIYLAETNKGKYIIKTMPYNIEGMENEGFITDFLLNNNIKVAKLLKTKDGGYVVKKNGRGVHVQEFINGTTLNINTAPEWFLEKSADILGRINAVLKNYGELPINFGADFFCKNNINGTKQHYSQMLGEAAEQNNVSLIPLLEKRLQHLERMLSFDIDANKLTYSNSHGDFWLSQIIENDTQLTVIDWTSACRLPICLEIMYSYVTADPECANGTIHYDRLKRYIGCYSKHFQLNAYEIKMMPYIFYHQQIMCHYPPPYDAVPDTYKPICALINKFTDWLFENVDILSAKLYSE